MNGTIEKIFIATAGGQDMQPLEAVDALAGGGLQGDRYCRGAGYWSRVDECEVTLIESEHLDEIAKSAAISVESGEHRRNLVTRGVRLGDLMGKRFQVGGAVLEFDRPRPPCGYIESLTERGMTKSLIGRGGICARVVQSGTIRVNDAIVVLSEPRP
jgi:MOSC domain-containing protein YiiM